MLNPPLRLRDDAAIDVIYRDRTPGGSPVGRRPCELGRRIFAPMLEHLEKNGWASVLASVDDLLDTVLRSAAFGDVADLERDGSWRLRSAVLHPDPTDARPAGLAIRGGRRDAHVNAQVPLRDWPALHRLVSRLSRPTGVERVDDDYGDFVAALDAEGLLEAVTDDEADEAVDSPLTFLGHNTTIIRGERAAVIADPFFLLGEPSVPHYQPLPRRLLGPIDAVLLTHSHPDHFDPASLLRFAPSTAVIVPSVDRESLLAVDLDRRLRELGFTDVRLLDWWESTKVGDLTVTALPFYGEQPTDGPVLHPEIRNDGNTYLVERPGMSVALLADSGRDHMGDIRLVAGEVGAERRVDIVFGGYRGWTAYPVELLLSSVAQYLLFVPPAQWRARQQLMNGPDEAVDAAERFGARWLVPYADGGGPWHWTRGLGPVLAGDRKERSGFDPFPERVREVAASRSVTADDATVASSVDVQLMRPGDFLASLPDDNGLQIDRRAGYAWPW